MERRATWRRYCWFKKPAESNVANSEKKSEDDWDAVAYLAMEEEWDAEASSWWCSENEVLPDSRAIEDTLQEKMGDQAAQVQSSPDELEELLDGHDVKQEVPKSPWQTGVCQPPREVRPSEVEVSYSTITTKEVNREYRSQIPNMPAQP